MPRGIPNAKLAVSAADESDDDLGIESVEALDAILSDPRLQALVERAVQTRVAEMASAQMVAPNTETAGYMALIKAVEHMLEVQSIQIPGYIKPLTAEEMDRREAGRVEMWRLLAYYRERANPAFEGCPYTPRYVLRDQFYGPSPNGEVMYEAGQEIRCFLPPAEHFLAQNEPAAAVYAAMITWIGGETPDIAEQVAAALAARKTAQVPLVGTGPLFADSPVAPVGEVGVRHNVAPKRQMGTLVEERSAPSIGMAQRGGAPAPAGPVFVG